MKDTPYIDKFMLALKFYDKIYKTKYYPDQDLATLKEALLNNMDILSKEFKKTNQAIRAISESEVRERQKKSLPVVKNCHAVSTSIHAVWNQMEWAEHFKASVTIGNIYYKGENYYNVSKSRLKLIYNEGFNGDKALGVHVWLTMEDMTVIDASFLSTLEHQGVDIVEYGDSPVLAWSDKNPGDFHYEPLLVDNDFFLQVDRPTSVL